MLVIRRTESRLSEVGQKIEGSEKVLDRQANSRTGQKMRGEEAFCLPKTELGRGFLVKLAEV